MSTSTYHCDLSRIVAVDAPSDHVDFYPYESHAEMVKMLGLSTKQFLQHKEQVKQLQKPKGKTSRQANMAFAEWF